MPHRCSEAAKIMDGANEHHPETNPEKARQPTEGLTGQDRAGDGPRGGNGGKVLREQVKRAGGHVVDPVLQGHRRRWATVIHLKPARYPPAIETIGRTNEQKKANGQKRQVHGMPSSRSGGCPSIRRISKG